MSKKKVLVVDDETQILRVLRHVFSGPEYSVKTAQDGAAGMEAFTDWQPDIVITDLQMPVMNGLELCRRVRSASAVPVIVLSVRDEEKSIVEALDSGADDYVTKPFSPKELLARVRAVLRRARRGPAVEQFYFDEVSVDFGKMEVFRGGAQVSLTPQEFKLLKYFSQSPERVISRDQLLSDVWGYNSYPSTRTVDSHILTLRQKLERDPANPVHFLTVHNAGYKFVP